MCQTDTLVHPIDDEDNAIALIRFESGAIGQFEVSWTFRGGMDLRDEVAGTDGTIWLNHFLRTGFEMFTAGGQGGYVAEKAETSAGWLFPVGDEVVRAGLRRHVHRHVPSHRRRARAPQETFYDGYVVNAIMDACYRSAKSRAWEPIELFEWRGGETRRASAAGRQPETATTGTGRRSSGRSCRTAAQKLILKDRGGRGDFVADRRSCPRAETWPPSHRAPQPASLDARAWRRAGRRPGHPAGHASRAEQLVDDHRRRPMTPARPPSDERWIDQVARRQRQRAAVDRLADGGQQLVAAVGHAAADDDQRRVEEVDDAGEHRARPGGRRPGAARRATGSPNDAARATSAAVTAPSLVERGPQPRAATRRAPPPRRRGRARRRRRAPPGSRRCRSGRRPTRRR